MRVLCCPEVGWVTKIWGVTFLVVPPKDKFVAKKKHIELELTQHKKTLATITDVKENKNQSFRLKHICQTP